MPVLTIDRVEEGNAKVGKVFFKEDPKRVVKYWKSAAFAADLKAGASAEATFETVKSQKEGYEDEKFLKSWNGVSGKGRGFGGGGGYKGQPKDDDSIAAQVCVKGAVEIALHNGQKEGKPTTIDPTEVLVLASELAKAYNAAYKVIKGGKE